MTVNIDSPELLAKYKLDNYVKEIFVIEDNDETGMSSLPFFADGYPGIMFQRTENGAFLLPANKPLSTLFMYGQTIQPIEIVTHGNYQIIVFQLFPFAAKMLFDVNPKELNDDCYNLNLVKGSNVNAVIQALLSTSDSLQLIDIMATFLTGVIQHTVIGPEQHVQVAVNTILTAKGKINIKTLCNRLYITERTLQRQFEAYVGVSPKQFAKIIQFQSALTQLSDETFSRISDIVYHNGYADQSHFIRNFKKFTGEKPSQYKKPE